MSLLPLILGIGSNLDAEGKETSESKSQPKLKPEKVLERDNYACRFCDFRSVKYQRVIRHNKEDVTVCSFCEQVLHLERAAFMGSAILIWLPEVTQVQLNHIVRAAYIAESSDDANMRELAVRMTEALKSRRTEAKRRIGTDDPMLFYTVLQEGLQGKSRADLISKIEGIRVFPLDQYVVKVGNREVNAFPKMVQFWKSAEGPFAKLPAAEWAEMFKKFKRVES
ncbi:MAG: hypothetical protein FWE93_05295 [Alphaproteobacteria bacterium]|nr:hypothetical protein [Alphaproteobacteria bacterium]